jgi:hypothetical protein
MQLEIIMLSEMSQTKKDKYHMLSLIWKSRPKNMKNEMNIKLGGYLDVESIK